MAFHIKIELDHPISNGETIVFKSPVESEELYGLKIYYPETPGSQNIVSEQFYIYDANDEMVSKSPGLFSVGAYVTVVLDTIRYINNTNLRKAYIQNPGIVKKGALTDILAYIGNGNYGQSNKCQIDLTINPRMVWIIRSTPATGKTNNMSFLFPLLESGKADKPDIIVELKDNKNGSTTVTWYSTESADDQMNENNVTYYLFAIGASL